MDTKVWKRTAGWNAISSSLCSVQRKRRTAVLVRGAEMRKSSPLFSAGVSPAGPSPPRLIRTENQTDTFLHQVLHSHRIFVNMCNY